MAFWFAGAASTGAPKEFQRGEPITGKFHNGSRHPSHLDHGTLAPSAGSRAHGKRRPGFGDSYADGDQVSQLLAFNDAPPRVQQDQCATPRHARLREHSSHLSTDLHPLEPPRAYGVRVFKTPTRGSTTTASSISATPLASADQSLDNAYAYTPRRGGGGGAPAPYASDINNVPAVPYIGMRRKIDEPRAQNTHDGDAFVLKRSRTPPAGAKYKETSAEGFGVLLASSLKSRANPQMVPSSRYGKLAAQKAEQAILEQRFTQELAVEQSIQEKSIRAYAHEKRRMEEHQQPERLTGRSRCSTPPATVRVPFALNYPTPKDTVGKRLSAGLSPKRWVR
ncbi:Hypothetical protein, putative [Bodo saltans]|uniref:Uncharacterized protein n=1 Tax=Bodo saltans TaxID=75058 RepID=A0A0S4IKT0_BODSA|nr:Hypothetical protein, putative [Bodo saltans]|eukprot:CUE68795.1 Hypothetical protein, putative [Bodo saltans]